MKYYDGKKQRVAWEHWRRVLKSNEEIGDLSGKDFLQGNPRGDTWRILGGYYIQRIKGIPHRRNTRGEDPRITWRIWETGSSNWLKWRHHGGTWQKSRLERSQTTKKLSFECPLKESELYP